jgi:hypothetical protein
MTDSDLGEQLSRLGFPMLSPQGHADAGMVLMKMAASRDPRLWEGFAVVLANSCQQGLFDFTKAGGYLNDKKTGANLRLLFLMSLALYKALGLKFSWADKLRKNLKSEKEFRLFLGKLKADKDFGVAEKTMSACRLKEVFTNYFSGQQEQRNNFLHNREEMGLEYAMSQVFSPKQKELFFKKLKGEKLTKTEKEYYSRAVKKKVLALANDELHRMARQML